MHRDIGPGLLETAYEAFLAALLTERGLRIETQKPVPVTNRGVVIREAFRVDLLVEGTLIVEVKSLERLAPSTRSSCSPISGSWTCPSGCS